MWIATLAAIIGIPAAYYGIFEPDIRAVEQLPPPALESAAPVLRGDTAIFRFSGTHKFRNHSIRGGGYIDRMDMIPEIPGLQSQVLLSEISRETFGPLETKEIEFQGEVAVTFDPNSGRVNTLPLVVRFYDNGGAVIMSEDNTFPFELGFWLLDAHDPTGAVRLKYIGEK